MLRSHHIALSSTMAERTYEYILTCTSNVNSFDLNLASQRRDKGGYTLQLWPGYTVSSVDPQLPGASSLLTYHLAYSLWRAYSVWRYLI